MRTQSILLKDQSGDGGPLAHVQVDLKSACLPVLSWDTEGRYFNTLADSLKKSYRETFCNSETG